MTKKRLPAIIAIALAAALAINAPMMISAVKERRRMSESLHRYSDALIQKDYAQAYLLSTREFKEATSFERFVAMQTRLSEAYGDLKRLSTGAMELHISDNQSKWISRVDCILEYQRMSVPITFELHFEDGEWRVFGFKQRHDGK
jgi:hypothetical protein